MIKSLGLDLSLTAPGLVLLAKEQGSKTVETVIAEQIPVPAPGKMGRWDRVLVVGDHVAEVIEAHEPGVVVIEGYGQVRHGGVQSFVKCVEVGTLVRLVLHAKAMKWLEVPPQSLKKFVTGKGNLPSGAKGKRLMCEAVAANWGHETTNHNVADAFGLARIGLAYRGQVATTKHQLDVLDNLSGK